MESTDHNFSYANCLAASERIRWRVEDVIGGSRRLDFTRPFLPESLACVEPLAFLTPLDKLAAEGLEVAGRGEGRERGHGRRGNIAAGGLSCASKAIQRWAGRASCQLEARKPWSRGAAGCCTSDWGGRAASSKARKPSSRGAAGCCTLNWQGEALADSHGPVALG